MTNNIISSLKIKGKLFFQRSGFCHDNYLKREIYFKDLMYKNDTFDMVELNHVFQILQ